MEILVGDDWACVAASVLLAEVTTGVPKELEAAGRVVARASDVLEHGDEEADIA